MCLFTSPLKTGNGREKWGEGVCTVRGTAFFTGRMREVRCSERCKAVFTRPYGRDRDCKQCKNLGIREDGASLYVISSATGKRNHSVSLWLINPLKPPGHVMHQQFNIQQLYVLPTLYLCVLYLSENKKRLVPLTA